MNNEEKLQLYSCIKRQFTDPGLYKSSRIYEWMYTNGYSLEKLGYDSFEELCRDFPEVFVFQDIPNSEFVLIKSWQNGDSNISDRGLHPADNFFGTKNIILNDDIIEMTQQSLYALTKILNSSITVQQMKQEVFNSFEEAKQSNKLDFLGEKYVFPIDYCPDGQLVNGIITKNLNAYGKSLYFSFEKTRISRGVIERKQPIAIPAEIPEEEKMHIYSLLIGNFPLNHQLHMAAISKYLTDRGVDRTKFGFYKMKDFLAQLNYLELKEIVLGGVPQILVTIKDLYSEKGAVNSTVNFPLYNRDNNRKASDYIGHNIANKIPVGQLGDFCNLPEKPMAILEKFVEESGRQIDYYDLTDAIAEDFDDARRNGTVRFYGEKLIFPCRFKKNDGSNVELTLKPSTYEGKEWFLYYVDTLVHENKISAVSPVKQLESFAYLGNWQIMLSGLASLAAEEEWDFENSSHKSFQILNQYLKFTFSRILREKKLCISPNNEFAAFNTGLVDKHYDDIYACFVPNDGGGSEWKLVGFCTAFSSVLGKSLTDIFNPLPIAPEYFTRYDDMFFDFNKYLHIDYEHLLLDNICRFPLSFLYEQLFDNQQAREILDRLRSVYEKSERIRLFEQIKKIIASNSRLSLRLQNSLKSSVELAKKRVRHNYKTAVPSYFPKHDSIALMLPLALDDEKTPDVALVLEITRLGSYQAQTILTLSQAYIDARLVSCMSAEWLFASQINSLQTSPEFSTDEDISAIN
ncbi:MAG: DUF3825 domain-containing protein [Oscillospiraceae bacterium]|nr:DUF3825 domain-containing protein [Oscillospiraceae bacterium]